MAAAGSSVPVIPYDASEEPTGPALPDVNGEHYGAAMRNRGPILGKIKRILAAATEELAVAGGSLGGAGDGAVAVEIGSGTGCHVGTFAAAVPSVTWQPSEYIPGAGAGDVGKVGTARPFDGDRDRSLEVIDDAGCKVRGNILPAVALDASQPFGNWPEEVRKLAGRTALVFTANVVHISPWEVTAGLFAGVGELLSPQGRLVIYGPFKKEGVVTTESNAAFDASLRQRDPRWGYRDIESEIVPLTERCGLALLECHAMPANNLLLCFGRRVPTL